jgi:hypothetical protein
VTRGRSVRFLAIAIACIAPIAIASAAPANAVNVGTVFELEFFKDFEPTGYGNTCQGTGSAGAFKAGSVLLLGIPFGPGPGSMGTAQMQVSELSGRGTCVIRYVGTAPLGLKWLEFQARDPFGAVSPVYADPKGETPVPISRPDQPSISQLIHMEMFNLA